MLDALIRWSLHNRLAMLCGAAAFLAWGGYAALRMPVDGLPELNAPAMFVALESASHTPRDLRTTADTLVRRRLLARRGSRR